MPAEVGVSGRFCDYRDLEADSLEPEPMLSAPGGAFRWHELAFTGPASRFSALSRPDPQGVTYTIRTWLERLSHVHRHGTRADVHLSGPTRAASGGRGMKGK